MKKYNHAFTIAFSIESDNEGEDVTVDELIAGLTKRVSDILNHDKDEIIEAVGLPYDTYENE